MRRYRPIERIVDVPYVPTSFLATLASLAEEGSLIAADRRVPSDVTFISDYHLRITIPKENDVLVLRFDTLDIWKLNDHTIRFRVSYKGWFSATLKSALDVGVFHFVVAFILAIIAVFVILAPDSVAPALASIGTGADSEDEAKPLLRPIQKRLRDIAQSLPA